MKRKRLNVQGMAIKSELLVGTIHADPGRIFVAEDCLHPDTEYLTPRGWVKVLELHKDDLVWQVDKTTLNGSFVKPTKIIKKQYEGNLVRYHTVRGELTVTENHRMLFVGQQKHKRKDKALWRGESKAKDPFPSKACNLPLFTNSLTTSNYSEKEIWLACMFQADSHMAERVNHNTYAIEVSRPRKRAKVRELLGLDGVVSKPHGTQKLETEKWGFRSFNSPLLKGKQLQLDSLGANQLDVFLDALCFWDGSYSSRSKTTGRFVWGSTDINNVEEVQKFLVKNGCEARMYKTQKAASTRHKDFYVLSITKKGTIRCFSSKDGYITKEIIPYSGLVGCVQVPSTYILVRSHGQCFVTGNCIAAEPVITSLLSGCEYYTYATYTGIGKKPFWNRNILMVNDLYLMFGSVNPLTKQKIKEVFNEEEWMKDSEAVKAKLKKERSLNKLVCLSSAYGVGAKKLQSIFLENGYKITLEQTKEVLAEYWNLFKKIKQTINRLSRQFEKQGYLINLFGYRVVPRKPQDSLNAINQSSVAGLIGLFMKMKFEQGKHLDQKFVTQIHDCVITEIPIEMIEETKLVTENVLIELNKELQWDVPIRMDFHASTNFYGLK